MPFKDASDHAVCLQAEVASALCLPARLPARLTMQWFANRSGVFVPAGIFPLSAAGFEQLQAAMERLTLNDASGAVPQGCLGNPPGQP